MTIASGGSEGGRRRWLVVLASAVALAGLSVLAVAYLEHRPAPEPDAGSRGHIVLPLPPATTGGPPHQRAPTQPQSRQGVAPLQLPASAPTRISIPAINVDAAVISIGQNPDGSLAVPQPGPNLNKVAWYRYSATPGAPGPAVLEGHVDTTTGPSIFYDLGGLHLGDRVTITRADHAIAVFTITAVRQYPSHADFPINQVFTRQLAIPSLRLITCSNFDHTTGHYIGNTIVYAHLTDVHRPPRADSASRR